MRDDVRYTSFDRFTFDLATLELTRDGRPVSIQPQPARVLAMLVRNAGRLVTRDALRNEVWPQAVVDREKGLNTAVRQVREALGERAGAHRFVETLPRRGYRFVHEVTVSDTAPAAPLLHVSSTVETVPTERRDQSSAARFGAARAVVAAGIVSLAVWTALSYRSAEAPAVDTSEPVLAYAKARHFLNQREPGSVQRAAAYFREAVENDGEVPEAWSGLAEASLRLEDMATARVAAERALALDAGLAEGHRVLGAVMLLGDRDFDGARAHFEESVAFATQATDFLAYAFYLFLDGKPEDGLAQAEQAYRMDPLSSALNGEVGLYYLWAGQPARALERCQLAAELDADDPWALSCIVRALESMGQHADMLQYLERLMVLQGADNEAVRGVRQSSPAAAARAYRAWRIRELEALPPNGARMLVLARLYAAEGEVDRAIASLEAAAANPTLGFATVMLDPEFRPLTEHPEFARLMEDFMSD